MNSKKISFEESLEKSVVDAGKCLGCGACVVICPFNCLEYEKGRPSLAQECKICGICPQVCPQYDWSWSKIENFIFGRERKTDEEFGVYSRMFIARAKDDKIIEQCQDGGIVTALLTFALQNGLIDSAVVSGLSQEKPFCPEPRLATTVQDIVECSGTRYSYSPNILALLEGIKEKRENMAFVGTPCQIHAIRRIQMLGLKKFTKPLKFLIGLMCSECFTYDGLMEKYIHGELGVDLNEITKMNIKGKILVNTNSGVKTIPLSEAKKYARGNCKFCDDFSSELADISVGGLGLDGWTFTIIRTDKGEDLFSRAIEKGVIETRPMRKEEFAQKLLVKLSKKKRKAKEG
ncbi:MAG: Coenzyme F420 hydrogenase/dehydrogenase, beta subunit C-terminal domain [Candidatus Bathyarchaeota archaeon]|jgi:coenzyme F420 hydrogenase subunit beta